MQIGETHAGYFRHMHLICALTVDNQLKKIKAFFKKMSAKWVENERKNEKWVERTHFFQIEFERSVLTFLKVRNESESTRQICERSMGWKNLKSWLK